MVLASVGFGVQGILAKYAYEGGADVRSVLAVRFAVATLVLWGLLPLMPRSRRVPVRQPPRSLLGAGALGLLFVSNSLFYYQSLTLLPAGIAAVLVFVFPALVALWSALFLREPLTRPKLGALGLALLGCFLTVDPSGLSLGAGLSLAGVAWAFGSAFSNSWYVTLAAMVGRGMPPLAVALFSLPVTAACFLGYLLLTGGFSPGITPWGWASCVALGVLAGLSVYVYLAGVGLIGASRASVTATVEPAVALLLGALLLAEPLTTASLLGAGCILGAVALLSQPDR